MQITQCLLEEVNNGRIGIDELKRIEELLLLFEDKFRDEQTKKGELLIRPEYKEKRIIKVLVKEAEL
jgi:hypothetical protein